MIYVLPYCKGSESAKLLVEQLNGKLIKVANSKFKWNKPAINWGNHAPAGKCLNQDTTKATNKIKAFMEFEDKGVPHVPFTLDKKVADDWVAKGKTVMARVKPAAQGGAGIVILNEKPDTVAPLYTMYIKKKAEYRVHVAFGKVLHIQEKKKKNGVLHNLIQSHNNGFVFGKPVGVVPPAVSEAGIGAVGALGLDFGAVDIIWNEHQGKAFVLEVNTAPGLSLTTAVKYAQAFKEHFNV